MNVLDNIERSLEQMGHNLRGEHGTHGLQPRDVLQAVVESVEANRVEGLDHKMYAPNFFTVQLHLDEEERSRILPFVGPAELEASIQRYCESRKYYLRGPLELEIVDAGITTRTANPPGLDPRGVRPHTAPTEPRKVFVESRFNVQQGWEAASETMPPQPPPLPTASQHTDPDNPPYNGRGYAP